MIVFSFYSPCVSVCVCLSSFLFVVIRGGFAREDKRMKMMSTKIP